MNSYPEKPEPVDWSYYSQNIAKPNLVDEFKKQYEALSIPYPKDVATAEIEALQQKTVSSHSL